MRDWLAERAKVSPHKIALTIENNTSFTYIQLSGLVTFHAQLFQRHIRRDSNHVAVLMLNDLVTVMTYFALLRLGVVIVPLNIRLSAQEIRFQVEQANCSQLLYDDRLSELTQNVQSETCHIISFNEALEMSIKEKLYGPYTSPFNLEDPLAIIHTSGTSGKPKAAVLTYGNMFYSAMASAYRIGHLPDDKWLCVLPLYHVGGLSILIRAVLYGITVDLREKFDVNEINHALTHDDITLVSLVPTMLYRLLEARVDWNPKLRLVLVGGAATTPELIERCKQENIPIATTYGLTEAASQVATTLPDDALHKVGTVGKPLMFTQVRIVDKNGKDKRRGEHGEIIVSGSTIMQGYYDDEAATNKALRDGWLYTGDIGYFDKDGDLFLVQRRSDLIVSGGENVYPSEVEAVLREHPAIKHVAVVGIDNAEWGQKVAAAIVLKESQSLTKDEVEKYCREHLAGYKTPRLIRFIDKLPMTGSGKIRRSAVKKLFDIENKQ